MNFNEQQIIVMTMTMTVENTAQNVKHDIHEAAERNAKRAYQPPQLQVLGDIRGLTLGGTKTPSDSGGGLRRSPV